MGLSPGSVNGHHRADKLWSVRLLQAFKNKTDSFEIDWSLTL